MFYAIINNFTLSAIFDRAKKDLRAEWSEWSDFTLQPNTYIGFIDPVDILNTSFFDDDVGSFLGDTSTKYA
jgi:hypothetical protein